TPTRLADGTLYFPANAPLVNPNFGPISQMRFWANSFYHSFQASVEHRFYRDLQFQIAYTFSKMIDDTSAAEPTDYTSDPGHIQNPFNLRDSRAISSLDHSHVFV